MTSRLALLGLLVPLACGPAESTTGYLRAKRDLPAGAILSGKDLARGTSPGQVVPPNVVLASDKHRVLGRELIYDLHTGDPLVEDALSDEPVKRIAERVRIRGVAYEVPVRLSQNVLRLDHVDILGLVPHDDQRLVYLMQNVIVMRVRTPPKPTHGTRLLSLLLLPEEAQIVALAHSYGPLFAVLRHREDISSFEGDREPARVKELADGCRHLRLSRERLGIKPPTQPD